MLPLIVLALTGLVAAQYGVPSADPAPAYAPAVPIYAPQPAILPELPASHEILWPRRRHYRHHGHRHSSSRSSSSESRENKPKCAKCKNLQKNYPKECTNCFRADITYLTHKGCKAAYIECPKTNFETSVFTGEEDVLASGQHSSSKLVKCSGKEWKSFEIGSQDRVTFDRVYCRWNVPDTKAMSNSVEEAGDH